MPGFDLRASSLMAGLLMAAALPVFADYKQDYARGKNAAAEQNWDEVETRMREALAGSQTPLARTRLYGQRFEPYVPQYYLGLAAYRQNNCSEALRWFNDPAAASIIAGNSEFEGVAAQARNSCKAAVAVVSKPPAPTKPVVPPTEPVVSTPPPATTPPPTKPTTPPSSTTPPAATTPPVAATAALPRTLQGLLDDYLSGRYSNAAIADANTVTGVGRFHALLLRSAARHQLYLLQSADAASQRAGAEADIRLAKTLAPGKSPDTTFFSPRYRQFFSEVR